MEWNLRQRRARRRKLCGFTVVPLAVGLAVSLVARLGVDPPVAQAATCNSIQKVADIGTSSFAVALNSTTQKAYIGNFNDNTVSVVNVATGDSATIATGSTSGPFSVAANPVTNLVYVLNREESVTVIDGSTDSIIATLPIISFSGHGAIYLAVDSVHNKIYVANSYRYVTVIDGATNQRTVVDLASLPVYQGIAGIAVDSSSNRFYLATYPIGTSGTDAKLAVFDGSTLALTENIFLDANFSPAGVAVNSSTHRVYAADASGNRIAVVDGATKTVLTMVSTGSPVQNPVVNETTNRIYAPSFRDDLVAVIDGSTNTALNPLATHDGYGVAVDEASGTVYVTTVPVDENSTITGPGELDALEDCNATGPPPGVVTRSGTSLQLDGQPYRPIGLNIYNANSNGWCWYAMDGPILNDSLTAIGSGKNAMRAWFFQQLATTNGSRDWTAFDRTLAAARAHGYKVVATLIDQWGDCGTTNGQGYGYKDETWYESGYRQPDPSAVVSYRDWVREVAARYRNDPTILAWQLVNEPEVLVPPCRLVNGQIVCAACDEPSAVSTLESFATDVGDVVKAADPNHLVSLGTIGSGQCGAQFTDFKRVMSVPSIDLCEFHDYEYQHPMPGDQFNGLQFRLDQCNQLDKPLLVGELGVKPSQVGGTLKDRAAVVAGKVCAQLRAGVAGALLWAWDKDGSLIDNFDIGPSDPVLDVLTPWSNPAHTCSVPAGPSGAVAAPGDSYAAVAWLPPATDGGSPVTSYTISSQPGGVSRTVPGDTTSTTLTGLSNGTSYTFTVVANNVVGQGAASAASTAVVPKPGNVAAAGVAFGSETATVSTGSDPATTGGVTSSVTVPVGTSGAVTLTQTATSETAPVGYQFGGVQIEISAPTATATTPLTLVFTGAPPAGAPLNNDTLMASQVFRAEGGGPQAIGTCTGVGADPAPACVSDRRYVTIGGATYIRVTILATSASHWNSARPVPSAVGVSNNGYTPATVTVQPAGRVSWTFTGNKAHSVTDSLGLGASARPLFDSGAKSAGSFSTGFPAAGNYSYRSTVKGDTMTGSVLVPLVISHASASYVVIWAAGRLPGYVFDVQYRFKPARSTKWGSWVNWKSGSADPNASFTPTLGAGTYSFQARLRNASTGKVSGNSPQVQFTAP